MLRYTVIDTDAGSLMDNASVGDELCVSKNENRCMFVTIRAEEQKKSTPNVVCAKSKLLAVPTSDFSMLEKSMLIPSLSSYAKVPPSTIDVR
jgi:hypothetical protein